MEAVKVITRVRPLSQRDIQMHNKSIVNVDKERKEVAIASVAKENDTKSFPYDGVYDPRNKTGDIFTENIVGLLDGALDGYNCTIFAYGQTGSGKTYTMHGQDHAGMEEGIVFRAIDYVFDKIDKQPEGYRSLVYCSFLEIYMEEFRDLLKPPQNPRSTPDSSKSKLSLHEGKDRAPFVEGLSTATVQNAKECRQYLKKGLAARQQASTKMNTDSSRSHAIFTITLEVSRLVDGANQITMAKMNFVDLAGSERQTKAEAIKDRQNEAIRINLSLSTLGRVIQALTDGKSTHIPYRDSKLTRLLETSLGGNAKTVMISCISPADDNREESLSTLSYASRVKSIRNKPVINTDPQTALIRQYLEHIRRLERQISRTPNDEAKQQEIETIKAQHRDEMKQLEKEQEDTLRKFEIQMKLANEEDKKLLIKQKDEELERIYAQVTQKQKDEYKRLEMEKAEDLKRLEEKLQRAAAEEKRRIQMEFAEEMKQFKEETEFSIHSQKQELEVQQQKELDSYRNLLREQTDQERNKSITCAKELLQREFEIKLEEERQRYKEQLEETKATLKTQYEEGVKDYHDQKQSELKLLHDENLAETRKLLDNLLIRQDKELQRLVENQAKLNDRLQREHDVNLQKKATIIERQKDRELSALKELYEKQIVELQRKHQQEVANVELTGSEMLQQSERSHLKEISELNNIHMDETDQLKRSHALELQTQLKRSQMDFDARFTSAKQHNTETLTRTEEEYKNRLDLAKVIWEKEYNTRLETVNSESEEQRELMEQQYLDKENEISELRNRHQQEISALQKSNKEFKKQLQKLANELAHAEQEKVRYSKQAKHLEDLETEHKHCQNLLVDQQQKVKEMEAQVERLREELHFTQDTKIFLEQQMRELNKVRTLETLRYTPSSVNGKNGIQSTASQISSGLNRSDGSLVHLSVSGRRLGDGILCHSRSSYTGSSGLSPKRCSVAEPKPPSSARREALIKAVAGIDAESFMQAAHREYEDQLSECLQHIQHKETEIVSLRDRLDCASRQSQQEMDEIHQEKLKHQQLAGLYRQIVNTVLPHLPECNYKNLHDVVEAATWNDIADKWQLPPVELVDAKKCELVLDSLRALPRRPGRSSSLLRSDQRGDRNDDVALGRSTPFDFQPFPSIELPQPLSSRTTGHKVPLTRTPRKGPIPPLRSIIF